MNKNKLPLQSDATMEYDQPFERLIPVGQFLLDAGLGVCAVHAVRSGEMFYWYWAWLAEFASQFVIPKRGGHGACHGKTGGATVNITESIVTA